MKWKKYLKGFVSSVLAVSMVLGTATIYNGAEAEEAETEVLQAVNTAENSVKTAEDQTEYYHGSGDRADRGWNFEEFLQTTIYKDSIASLYNYFTFPTGDQANSSIFQYWESRGVTKEYYDLYDPERQWAVYYPNGLYFEADEDYEYPVVFCLHGGSNSILMAESYGWSELCATEGFICVIPWAQAYEGGDQEGNLIVEEIPRILEILKENYSIDENRIFAVGFSAGGRSTTNVIMEYPDLFAAAACTTTALYPSAEEANVLNDAGYKDVFSYDDFDRITSYQMPLMLYGGTMDTNWPINSDPDLSWPVTTEDLNRWMNITGAIFPEVTDESREYYPTTSGIGVERIIGLDFEIENCSIIERQDTYCYIGDYLNEDGVCTLRCLAVEGMPHWPLSCEAELIWDFFSQFSRNQETGELEYFNS